MKKNIESIYPLSPMQQGMLFHTLQNPDEGMYFEQFACTLKGGLEKAVLRQACQRVLDHHPVLRTAFVWKGQTRQLQVVFRQVDLPWTDLDWRDVPAPAQAARLAEFMQADRGRGFELEKPPLTRMALIRLADEAYRFVWSHHHMLLDGWSLPLVLKDIFSSYEFLRRGEAPPLAPSRPYKDYIAWLQKQDLLEAETFWKETLAGFTAPTPLSALLGQRLPGEAGGYTEHTFALTPEVTARLQRLARQHRLTLNTLVQAAWGLLLSRYSGTRDVVFGSTVSGRPPALPGVESMVGLFINTLPLRVTVDPAERLIPWLQSLQARQAEMRQYEYTPLVQIQNWSPIPPGVSLFESILVFENYPLETTFRQAQLSLEVTDVQGSERTNYPLTLVVCPPALNEQEGALSLKMHYDGQQLDGRAVRRASDHLGVVLNAWAADPELRLENVPTLTGEERHRLLLDWNDTERAFSGPRLLHQLFEQQAEQNPAAVAVCQVGEGQEAPERQALTYRQLDQRANQVAHRLRELGVGPDVKVGVCAGRSVETVAGVLGVLKAGGAYVPLDPEYPNERLAFMLQDAGISLLLTQAPLLDRLSEGKAQVLCLDRDEASVDRQPITRPENLAEPENLAYVIYTSGSTGEPKGVMVSHANICNLVWAQIPAFDLSPESRVLQFASLNFDASVSEIFCTLSAGASLYLAPQSVLASGQSLVDWMRQEKITTVTLPPALLAVLEPDRLPALKTLVSAGETCHWEVAGRWADGRRLLNFYGPTEATIGTCYQRVTGRQPALTVPIGRPIDNVRLYVLDPDMKLVPLGVPGELYVGGAGVARGYLGRPGLTAASFVPDPFGPEPGGRLYRTGDLVRYLPDGSLAFLGRIDHQVKVRGFRVELGEIEAALVRHPDVSEAVVVARTDRPGDKRLVAYFVATSTPPPSLRRLRRFLGGWLPEHMVPGTFVVLDALPLTPSGKVDRKALPAPERPMQGADFVPPRNPVETQLAEIWGQVLGVEQVGVHSNFFELGGDSILSIQVVARASQAGLHLSVKQIFQYPTITELAAVVGTDSKIDAEQETVTGEAPLTPIQHWFFEQNLPEPHHFNQAFLLEARQPLRPALLEKTLAHLLRHQDALRARYERAGEGWRQRFLAPDGEVPFSTVDLRPVPAGDRLDAIQSAAAEAQRSLDLSGGPLMRTIYFDPGPQEPGWLLWVIHHLLVDGVSWRVLLEDWQTAYRQLEGGQAVQLPPKTTSYKRWAERLVKHARGGGLEQELDYWLGELQKPAASLPLDEPAGVADNTQANACMVTVSLDAQQTQDLLQQVPKAYRAEINDVLLAALAQTLARWTGQAALLVDLEGHGRQELFEGVDVSRTVGWFTALYPFRLAVEPEWEPEQALRWVKEHRRAVPHRGVGYGLLRYLHPDQEVRRALSQLPQPQVSFNYMGQFDQSFGDGALFVPSTAASGSPISPQARRTHLLDVAGGVTRGQLELALVYGQTAHRRATIEGVAERLLQALQEIIGHSRRPGIKSLAPSDFPGARVEQKELDRLMSVIGKKVKK